MMEPVYLIDPVSRHGKKLRASAQIITQYFMMEPVYLIDPISRHGKKLQAWAQIITRCFMMEPVYLIDQYQDMEKSYKHGHRSLHNAL
jgi:predicted metallopeptidase